MAFLSKWVSYLLYASKKQSASLLRQTRLLAPHPYEEGLTEESWRWQPHQYRSGTKCHRKGHRTAWLMPELETKEIDKPNSDHGPNSHRHVDRKRETRPTSWLKPFVALPDRLLEFYRGGIRK